VNTKLWIPDNESVKNSLVSQFQTYLSKQYQYTGANFTDLHEWSVSHSPQFWKSIWAFCDVKASSQGNTVVHNVEAMPGAKWFPEAKLNFAENLLRRRDEADAIVFRNEMGDISILSWAELYDKVSCLSAALRLAGLRPGDRVAGFMPNCPEAIIAMLATTSLGGVWSSCSPDFGVSGVLDRFGQIEPKFLFGIDAYWYNGKAHDTLEKLHDIAAGLSTLEQTVIFPFVAENPDISKNVGAVLASEFTLGIAAEEIVFGHFDFNHPLYIMYSSGTTGVPKCIVHGAGGTLLQHLKEHQLHCNVKPGDRLFYFTTCGWMMWNWLVSALASEATIMLYDGSPFYPSGNVLFDYIDESAINIFGTSAKFIDACAKGGIKPKQTHNLGSLRSILSTGSPLSPESFDYVYTSVKKDVCLSSISGGTDIVSCFLLGSSTLPVYSGEIQTAALGMDVQVLTDDGEIAAIGEKGELCCMNSFPSMPIGFWNDPDDARYTRAYFEKFPNIWCHGDYVAKTEVHGWMIFGRSDAVLNPGGVRIGTAEIYRQAEKIDEVIESIVIGQNWNGDVRVVLFVRLREGVVLDDALSDTICKRIRDNTTPRHVPSKVIQVADIPRTKSGKIVELAVRKVVQGEIIKNKEALANPEALLLFRNIEELQKP